MSEFEYEAYVPGTSVWAQMNKVGGGTPPKQYVGTWEYTLRDTTRDGAVLMQGADLNIPLLVTHAVAAKTAFEFLAAKQEEPELTDWERELLASATDGPVRDVTADENAAMGGGYTRCACRDCGDDTPSSDMSKPELCELCDDAGCEVATGQNLHSECQRDDAYEEA